MTIDDKKDFEYVDYKVKYQEAENSCLERVSPDNSFFYALPYGSRAYGAALIVQQWLYYYSNCPESTKPRLHFCSFLISVSGEGHSTFSGAENTDL